jgi:Ca-activated chloride channel homolog
MAGRHASSRRRRSWPRRLFALITAVVLVAAGVAAANAFLEQRAGTCEQAPALVVAADPAIAPALSEFVDGYQDTAPAVEGMCTPIEVTQLPSAEVASGIGSSVRADMWVPDSSLWAEQVTAEGVALDVGQPLATSPLVVVAPRPLAEQLGWPDAQLSWDAVLDTQTEVTISDPTTSSEGLGTLLAVAAVVGGEPENRTRLVQAMSGVARSTVPSVAAAYEQVDADPAQAPIFTATEQSVVAHNTTSPASLVAALYPVEGTVVFDYPAIRVTTAATTAVKAEAAEAFETALHDPEAVEVLQDAGFRAPDGTPREGAGVVDGIQPAPPDAVPAPDPARQGRFCDCGPRCPWIARCWPSSTSPAR